MTYRDTEELQSCMLRDVDKLGVGMPRVLACEHGLWHASPWIVTGSEKECRACVSALINRTNPMQWIELQLIRARQHGPTRGIPQERNNGQVMITIGNAQPSARSCNQRRGLPPCCCCSLPSLRTVCVQIPYMRALRGVVLVVELDSPAAERCASRCLRQPAWRLMACAPFAY